MHGHKPKRKGRSLYLDELRDRNGLSTENHIDMTNRLVKAGHQGIHNKPGEPHKKHHKSK